MRALALSLFVVWLVLRKCDQIENGDDIEIGDDFALQHKNNYLPDIFFQSGAVLVQAMHKLNICLGPTAITCC
ncbi:MAG: hypothetical protein CLLPBCKN_007717 [Chroococcidiopsis cubana SAG 39.79]|nr:hypothetical protein [Chroococcidiopsis cubana SAG 39.79]